MNDWMGRTGCCGAASAPIREESGGFSRTATAISLGQWLTTTSPTRANDPVEIAQRILVLRGQRVLLDTDLAVLYGVSPKRLNEQVKRSRAKFPEDFVSYAEINELRGRRSQIATASSRFRNLRFPPLAFTEHGTVMAATVLNSPRAVETNVHNPCHS